MARRGVTVRRALEAIQGRQRFTLSVQQGTLDPSKLILNTLDQDTLTPLVRVEVGRTVTAHSNPDGTRVTGSHVHVWQSDVGTAIAVPLSEYPEHRFPEGDLPSVYQSLCVFCAIEGPPALQLGLS